ncbi:hypothetical protein ES708_21918 [subsurface metagenome]
MTIDEAIRIKEQGQHWLPKESYPELIDADNLSIEALKYVSHLRKVGVPGVYADLPGETKD